MPINPSSPNPPAPASSLVGRHDLVQAVIDRLHEPGVRLVTLAGPAGVGKTRLAIAAARQARALVNADIRFVSLAEVREPAGVVPAIAGSLDLLDAHGDDVVERLQASLAGRSVLLVADHVDRVIDAAPDFERLLAANPGLRMLVTSRSPLQVASEHVVEVPALTLPDAVQLFVDRACRVNPGLSLDDRSLPHIARIVSLLNASPLAIELVAAHAGRWSPGALVGQIENRVASGADGGDAATEDQVLCRVVVWSCGHQDDEDLAFLRRLSVFAGGCSVPAAAAVTGEPEDVAVQRLERLRAYALVAPSAGGDGEQRFTMLEPVRECAARHLASSDDATAARIAHLAWFRDLAARTDRALCGRHPDCVMAELDRDKANFRTALEWAIAAGRTSDAVALASTLWRYLRLRGEIAEGRSFLIRTLAMPGPGDPRARAYALCQLGWFSVLWGDMGQARAATLEAIDLATTIGDRGHLASALDMMGTVRLLEGDPASARPLHERAQAMHQSMENWFEASGALGNLGMLALHEGNIDEARDLLTRAVQMASDIGASYRWVLYLIDLARVEFAAGALDAAETLIGQASAELRKTRDHPDLILALMVQGQVAAAKGHHTEGLECLVESLRLRIRRGMTRNLGDALERLAIVAAPVNPDIAAQLLAAVQSSRQNRHLQRLPWDERAWRHARDAIRMALGQDRFSLAWQCGAKLSLIAASQRALECLADAATTPVLHHSGFDWFLVSRLTQRERNVFDMVARGMSNKEIAAELFLSQGTVKRHVSNALAKLNMTTRSAAAEAVMRDNQFANARRLGASMSMLAAGQIALDRVERAESSHHEQPSGDTAPLSGLTRREQEVFGLMAKGMSNRQIAEALSVRPGTVKRHVSNILAKLQVSSRSATVAMMDRAMSGPD